MPTHRINGVAVQVAPMTRDEFLSSEHAAPGYYPIENEPGHFVTNGGHFKIWLTESDFNFLVAAVVDSSFMTFAEAVEATGKGLSVRRNEWPEGSTLRNMTGRFMMISIQRGQRLLAPYAATPADATAKDWVAIPSQSK